VVAPRGIARTGPCSTSRLQPARASGVTCLLPRTRSGTTPTLLPLCAHIDAHPHTSDHAWISRYRPYILPFQAIGLIGAIASHARGRWFEPSRAHVQKPRVCGAFVCPWPAKCTRAGAPETQRGPERGPRARFAPSARYPCRIPKTWPRSPHDSHPRTVFSWPS
jgi:hypothetical protein